MRKSYKQENHEHNHADNIGNATVRPNWNVRRFVTQLIVRRYCTLAVDNQAISVARSTTVRRALVWGYCGDQI